VSVPFPLPMANTSKLIQMQVIYIRAILWQSLKISFSDFSSFREISNRMFCSICIVIDYFVGVDLSMYEASTSAEYQVVKPGNVVVIHLLCRLAQSPEVSKDTVWMRDAFTTSLASHLGKFLAVFLFEFAVKHLCFYYI
jgi:hypothetical protein